MAHHNESRVPTRPNFRDNDNLPTRTQKYASSLRMPDDTSWPKKVERRTHDNIISNNKAPCVVMIGGKPQKNQNALSAHSQFVRAAPRKDTIECNNAANSSIPLRVSTKDQYAAAICKNSSFRTTVVPSDHDTKPVVDEQTSGEKVKSIGDSRDSDENRSESTKSFDSTDVQKKYPVGSVSSSADYSLSQSKSDLIDDRQDAVKNEFSSDYPGTGSNNSSGRSRAVKCHENRKEWSGKNLSVTRDDHQLQSGNFHQKTESKYHTGGRNKHQIRVYSSDASTDSEIYTSDTTKTYTKRCDGGNHQSRILAGVEYEAYAKKTSCYKMLKSSPRKDVIDSCMCRREISRGTPAAPAPPTSSSVGNGRHREPHMSVGEWVASMNKIGGNNLPILSCGNETNAAAVALVQQLAKVGWIGCSGAVGAAEHEQMVAAAAALPFITALNDAAKATTSDLICTPSGDNSISVKKKEEVTRSSSDLATIKNSDSDLNNDSVPQNGQILLEKRADNRLLKLKTAACFILTIYSLVLFLPTVYDYFFYEEEYDAYEDLSYIELIFHYIVSSFREAFGGIFDFISKSLFQARTCRKCTHVN
ncbi:hypothetical protein QAD02_004763 [Eretmocerus hayati]|uniref:Uncharacterized protein n=1 Tax=Eretmocerus hayati TaxID=131215 RepID=A0ACC2NRJ0_9HYME|nr:hypothetical protein QAD02_004763 [Eretmocerus hayati]